MKTFASREINCFLCVLRLSNFWKKISLKNGKLHDFTENSLKETFSKT